MSPHPPRFADLVPSSRRPHLAHGHAVVIGRWITSSLPLILAIVAACGERASDSGVGPPEANPSDVPSTIGRDGFDRSSSAGWGSADIGGAWLYNTSDRSIFRVDASEGTIVTSSTAPRAAFLESLRAKSTAGLVSFRIDKQPDNPTRFHTIQFYARRHRGSTTENYYRFRVRAFGHGQMDLRVEKRIDGVDSWVSNEVTIPVKWKPAERYWVRWEAIGTSPASVIRMKLWRDGTTEPLEWPIATVIDEPRLDVAGTVGLYASPPSADQVTFPITYGFDSLLVMLPGTRNSAPVARFDVAPGAQANVSHAFDGTGSSDPDGSVPLAYHWDFGDGTTGSGVRSNHTFMDHGRFRVSLTVIDSAGLPSAKATREIVVGARAADLLVRDDFSRTLPNDWGMADAGGMWRRSVADPGVFATDGSRGIITAPAGVVHNVVAPERLGMNAAGLISFSVDVMPTQQSRFHIVQVYARRDDSLRDGEDYYRYRVRLYGNGQMDLQLEKSVRATTENVGGGASIPFKWQAGQRFWIRWEAVGTSPTTHVAMKVWPDGTQEPVGWQVEATVNEPRLDVVGTTGVRVHAASVLAVPAAKFAFDDLLYRMKQ